MPDISLTSLCQSSIDSPSGIKMHRLANPFSHDVNQPPYTVGGDGTGHIPIISTSLIVPFDSIREDGSAPNSLSAGDHGVAHDGSNTLRLPSRVGGDNYLQRYHGSRNWMIAAAEAGQTWTTRVWAYSPHTSNVKVTLWYYGVDEDGDYNHAGYSIGNGSGVDDTSYKKSIYLNDQNTWYQLDMTVTLKASADWITGITARLDNDYSGLDKYIYVDSWGLWRRDISMVEMNRGVTSSEIKLVDGIVEDDLLFLIDGGNKYCFDYDSEGTPDVCNDLVSYAVAITGAGDGGPDHGHENTITPSNFPEYSTTAGGCFDFVGGKGMNVSEIIVPGSILTIGCWIMHTSTAGQYLCDARNGDGSWWLWNYGDSGSPLQEGWNINIHQKLCFRFNNIGEGSSGEGNQGGQYATSYLPTNEWMYIVITSSSGGSHLYINGVEYTSDCVVADSLSEGLGGNFRIGTRYTTTSQFQGKLAAFQIYGDELTPAEVLQNFNAQKARFSPLWEN